MFPRLVWYLIHSQGPLNLGSSTFCVLGLSMHKPMFSFSYCNDYVSLDAWHGHLVGKMGDYYQNGYSCVKLALYKMVLLMNQLIRHS